MENIILQYLPLILIWLEFPHSCASTDIYFGNKGTGLWKVVLLGSNWRISKFVVLETRTNFAKKDSSSAETKRFDLLKIRFHIPFNGPSQIKIN